MVIKHLNTKMALKKTILIYLLCFLCSCTGINSDNSIIEPIILNYSLEISKDIKFIELNKKQEFYPLLTDRDFNNYLRSKDEYLYYLNNLIKSDSFCFFINNEKTKEAELFVEKTNQLLNSINKLELDSNFLKRANFLLGVDFVEVEKNVFVDYIEFNFNGYPNTLVKYNILNRKRNVLILDDYLTNAYLFVHYTTKNKID